MKIQPVWYRYNGKAGLPVDKKHVGVIAQEMQIIAPYTVGEFVYEDSTGNASRYLDYDDSAIVYMMINAIKELKLENDILRQELLLIKQLRGNLTPVGRDSRLYQNFPNPSGTETTIQFYVAEDVTDAELKIHAVNGQEVFSSPIQSRGEGSVEVSHHGLAAGTYVYSLFIGGRVVDNKKMIISR
jgi:hypothetical protein